MELLAIFPSEKNIEENQKYIYIYVPNTYSIHILKWSLF